MLRLEGACPGPTKVGTTYFSLYVVPPSGGPESLEGASTEPISYNNAVLK
jgi:hypothetical protein